jgi:hypothetical protein
MWQMIFKSSLETINLIIVNYFYVVFILTAKFWWSYQSSKWTFGFTGSNQILGFICIYSWIKTEKFTGLGPEDRCSSWRFILLYRCVIVTVCLPVTLKLMFTCFSCKPHVLLNNWCLKTVLEMKILIYLSKLNFWIYFYTVLNKNWKIYRSEQCFTSLGPVLIARTD